MFRVCSGTGKLKSAVILTFAVKGVALVLVRLEMAC